MSDPLALEAQAAAPGHQEEPIRQLEQDEVALEQVIAVRPATDDREGQVELGRRIEAECGGHESGASRPVRHAHSSTRQGLRPPLRIDPTGRQRSLDDLAIHRQLASQAVVDLLATLSESRLHDPIERVARGPDLHRRMLASAKAEDGRVDGGRGLERCRGDAGDDLGGRHVLGEDRQVAHPARRRGNPFGHLELDEQHRELRRPLALEERVEQRAGDVVRDVGHHLDRPAGEELARMQ